MRKHKEKLGGCRAMLCLFHAVLLQSSGTVSASTIWCLCADAVVKFLRRTLRNAIKTPAGCVRCSVPPSPPCAAVCVFAHSRTTSDLGNLRWCVCRGEEDAEKDEGDRAKYILRVTMANARKVQTVRLEKASEDQPLTGPPNEKLALTTKRLRGWKTDYEPPKGHERADYGGRNEEEREQEGDLYSSDEEGPVESGQLDYDQGFRSDDEEAGSSGEGALATEIVNFRCHRGCPLRSGPCLRDTLPTNSLCATALSARVAASELLSGCRTG